MGMFDYVRYEAPCKKCGELLQNWQSKDGDCDLKRLQVKDVNTFYDNCKVCGTRNEYKVSKTCVVDSIDLVEEL